jgi:hypothetical protein
LDGRDTAQELLRVGAQPGDDVRVFEREARCGGKDVMQHSGPARLVVILGLAIISACSWSSPAGFWTSYRPELIANRQSDQGPWGGIRWIQWLGPKPGTFAPVDAVRFAESKGWSCRKPVPYSGAQMRIWHYSGRLVFPLPFGPADHRPDNPAVENLPRIIDDDSWVIACDSGWSRVEPGTDKETPALGYIHLDAIGTRMAVYHLWGEI